MVRPIISHRLKTVFVLIPKCGSITVRNMLADNLGLSCVNDLTRAKEKDLDRATNYFWFTFVRHPLHRFISCYFDKVLGQIGDQVYKPLYSPGMSISQFCEVVVSTNDKDADWHYKSQAWYIGQYAIDFIGCLDNCEKGLEYVKEKLGLTWENKKMRPTEHGHFREYLTNPQIVQIKKRYAQDFELYERYRK